MKKSLIAAAVASAFAAPAAMAAVTINGEIDVAVERVDDGNESWNQGNNTHSRFWMDAVEEIGGGNKVKGHLEFDMGVNGYHGGNAANGGNGTSINNRNSFIGFQGDQWGEFRFGTQEGIFEATGYNVDPFHGAAGPGGNIVNGMGQSGIFGNSAVCNGSNLGCRRTDSTLTYISPNWGGFTFQADYALEGPTGTGPSSNKWTELDYGARYDGKFDRFAYRVYGAGIQVNNADLLGANGSPGTDSKDDAYRFGGGITWENLSLDVIYESLTWDSKVAGTKLEGDNWWFGGSYNIPTGKIAFGYIMMGKRDLNGSTIDNSDGSNVSVGYYHTLSKNAQLYVIYDKMTNKDQAGYNIQDVGTSAIGEDPSAIALGAILMF